MPPLNDAMVTTALELPGYRLRRNLGMVRGITVRSRSIVGNFLGGLQSLFGGNITIYTELCEQARDETYRDMLQHARQLGANAIIAVRYARPPSTERIWPEIQPACSEAKKIAALAISSAVPNRRV